MRNPFANGSRMLDPKGFLFGQRRLETALDALIGMTVKESRQSSMLNE